MDRKPAIYEGNSESPKEPIAFEQRQAFVTYF